MIKIKDDKFKEFLLGFTPLTLIKKSKFTVEANPFKTNNNGIILYPLFS
jgi:hypothetical protein